MRQERFFNSARKISPVNAPATKEPATAPAKLVVENFASWDVVRVLASPAIGVLTALAKAELELTLVDAAAESISLTEPYELARLETAERGATVRALVVEFAVEFALARMTGKVVDVLVYVKEVVVNALVVVTVEGVVNADSIAAVNDEVISPGDGNCLSGIISVRCFIRLYRSRRRE